jgi:hypothetical protein
LCFLDTQKSPNINPISNYVSPTQRTKSHYWKDPSCLPVVYIGQGTKQYLHLTLWKAKACLAGYKQW